MSEVKKTLYHSELVRRSPLELTIKSEPQKSKFKGQPEYVVVYDHENRMERQYSLENYAIGEVLSEWKGKQVTMRAEGRDEDANVFLEESRERGNSTSRQQSPQKPANRNGNGHRDEPDLRGERGREPERKKTKAEKKAEEVEALRGLYAYMKRAGAVYLCAMKEAKVIAKVSADHGYPFSTEDFRTVATTLYIEGKAHANIMDLPMNAEEILPPAEKEPAAPKQSYVPTPEEEVHPPDPEPEPEPKREPLDPKKAEAREQLKRTPLARRPAPVAPPDEDDIDLSPSPLATNGSSVEEEPEVSWDQPSNALSNSTHTS